MMKSMMEDIVKKQESQASLPDQLMIKSTTSSTKSSVPGQQKVTRVQPLHPPKKKTYVKLKPKTTVKKHYFTSGYGINESNAKDVSKEPSPFKYPEDLEEFAHKVMTKAWRNDIRIKELKVKCSQKPSYKDRQKQDLLHRLYVEEPTINSMKTILDIAPEYFKVTEGRPIPDRLDIKKYIDTVRDTLRTKIVNGYREDDIMLIEENLLLEQKLIDSIKENYNRYVNIFEEFLYRDHTSSMLLLRESDAAAGEAYTKYAEYKAVAKKYGAARSSLYNSEEKWRNCQMYEKFLFLVSPFGWRVQRQDHLSEGDEEQEENIFGKYQLSMGGEEISLTDLLSKLQEDTAQDKSPELYFTDPEQLLDVFRFMEMQNLNSLLHSEELALPLQQVRDGMRRSEEMFDAEIENLKEIIDKLEGGINWEEERAKYLEDLALKLIGNEFKKLVMDDEVLNLHVFVEDVYETRIGPNDANLSIAEMMKGIEGRYRHELLMLDKVPADQVATLERGCYAEQMMVMRLAEKAAKQYAELEQLTYRLNRAFAPPYKKTKSKELKKRSPPLAQRHQRAAPPRELTDFEAEYLEYFTDYCKYSDDVRDYVIQVVDNTKKEEKTIPDDDEQENDE
ncbi:unnamed protein product [Ceutorhynchus assimilis]|uniref:Uncharacterized protein n=1 Tax=Ceutorhynchus assimilis TaxID=467358 RepID=A0A9N9N001_9CUCU|nr:unnamed protein product [Ceutorhynchus assimilis]